MSNALNFLVLIPAFNEAKTIANVLRPLKEEHLPVVVVDDGSSDATPFVASDLGAVVVIFPENKGKADAVRQALRFNSRKVILLDADLVGLTSDHVKQLEHWAGIYDCARIILKGGRVATTWSHMISPNLAGQRILRTDVLEKFYEERHVSRFQLEVALEDFLANEGIKQDELVLNGVGQVMKEEKRGFWNGLIARFNMYRDIVTYKLKKGASR